jgi:hypothetical protein
MTDACFALQLFSDNWDLLQATSIDSSRMLAWVLGDDVDIMNNVQIGCNNDVMIHSGKGVTGIRLDGVNSVTMENIEIYEITDETPLGKTICGEYGGFMGGDSGFAGGHFRQTMPMQIGFSGNTVQGMTINAATDITLSNINVHDLTSYYGAAFGVALWPATSVTLKNDVTVSDITAGSLFVDDGTYKYLWNVTNKLPEACAVRSMEAFMSDGYEYTSEITIERAAFDIECISGSTKCFGSPMDSMYGESRTCQTSNKNSSRHNSNMYIAIVAIVSTTLFIALLMVIMYQKCLRSKNIQYSLLPKEDTLIDIGYGSIQH